LEIAKEIYNLDVKIRIVDSINDSIGGTVGPIELTAKTGLKSVVVKFRLDFDNLEYVMKKLSKNLYEKTEIL
jgi:guanylate cyclase